jgi:hypothetical protein
MFVTNQGGFRVAGPEDAINDLTQAHRQLLQVSRQTSLQFSVAFSC